MQRILILLISHKYNTYLRFRYINLLNSHIYLIPNDLTQCTIRENVQNVKFTNCPHAFPHLSVTPLKLALPLHCQRERTTPTTAKKIINNN